MRSFGSVVAGVVAFVAALVTVPALWVSTHVAQEDGYVEFSSSLATDDELQAAFAAYLSNEFVGRGVLPSALEQTATTALTQVAGRTSNQPGFVDAWEETQRNFHREAFADGAPATLVVDVGPMATFVADLLTGQLPVTLTVPDDLVVPVVSDSQDRAAIDRIKSTESIGRIGLIAVALAVFSSLVLARRRSTALVWLGLGAVVAAGVLKVVTSTGVQRVLDRVSAPSEFARTLQKLLVDRAADSLSGWLVWLAVAGAVAAVAGVAGRVVTGRPTA